VTAHRQPVDSPATATRHREPRLTLRVPEILKARIDSYTAKRKEADPKYALNDFFLEAARGKLDGNSAMPTVKVWPDPTGVEVREQGKPPRKFTAAEVAASIPGVAVGLPPATWGERADAPDEWSEVPTRPWLPELQRLDRLGRDGGDAVSEFNEMTAGVTFPPNFFKTWSLKDRAVWLDKERPLEAKP